MISAWEKYADFGVFPPDVKQKIENLTAMNGLLDSELDDIVAGMAAGHEIIGIPADADGRTWGRRPMNGGYGSYGGRGGYQAAGSANVLHGNLYILIFPLIMFQILKY